MFIQYFQISASANNKTAFTFTWTTPNASTVALIPVGPYVGVHSGTFTPGATYVIDLQLNTGSVIGFQKVRRSYDLAMLTHMDQPLL